ncbi:histone-fold-containing protein [Xylaria bambusicola]|nr:histone-fold-containing protein [Xylaria bambusicola]KAI0520815.1 histone-fold-containing protein [Xylaria bambusicola]
MPYNTTAIPPRKEVTGQAQLPLSRVKKIIAQDQDINICSNNAAFVITLATEMFIQYLASEGLNMAKLERKPRRNIQYKDLANAVSHQDNLQFLEDIIPKTVPYKQIKAHAAATRANLSGGKKPEESGAGHEDSRPTASRQTNGKKQKGRASNAGAGNSSIASFMGASGARIVSEDDASLDPNEQLQDEIRRAANRDDDDVHMAD